MRIVLSLSFVSLLDSSCAGHPGASAPHEEAARASATPAPAAPSTPAPAPDPLAPDPEPGPPLDAGKPTARCPVVTVKPKASEASFEVRFKLRATDGGDVVDELTVGRTGSGLQQTLRVNDMDALSVLDKCNVRTVDINFDGYGDLVVDTRAGASNTYAQYWLYDPTRASFSSLGEYPYLVPEPKRKRLKSHENSGSAGLEYEDKEYSVIDGALVLEKHVSQVGIADSDDFERTTRVREGSSLRVVKVQRVAAPK